MLTLKYELNGRTQFPDKHLPAAGLLVKASAVLSSGTMLQRKNKHRLGCTLTDQYGNYSIAPSKSALAELRQHRGSFDIILKCYDQDGNKLQTLRNRHLRWPLAASLTNDFSILQRPNHWHGLRWLDRSSLLERWVGRTLKFAVSHGR